VIHLAAYGILLAVTSMIFWGISDLTLKPLTGNFGTLKATVYKFIPHVFFLLIFFAVGGIFLPHDPKVWVMILAYGLVGAIGLYTFVRAINEGLVSINVTIAHTNVIFTAIIAAFALGEVFGPLQYVAIGVILAGIIMLSLDLGSLKHIRFNADKGIRYALITAVCWGIIWVLSKLIMNRTGPYAAAFYPECFVVLFIFLAFLPQRPSYREFRKTVLNKGPLLLILGSGLAGALGIILMVLSFTMEEVTISMGIISAAPFVTLVLARIFLKERIGRLQIYGILTAIAGIVAMSLLGGLG